MTAAGIPESGIGKVDILAAVGAMRFPRDANYGVHVLEDAIPDLVVVAFYPSFRWLNADSRDREDQLLLLTEGTLVRCRVTTQRFEVVDFGGAIDVRHDSRSVEIETIRMSSIRRFIHTRAEGPRQRGSKPNVETRLRIDFDVGVFDGDLTLPFEHDLSGADHNDKDEVGERVRHFAEGLSAVLARSSGLVRAR